MTVGLEREVTMCHLLQLIHHSQRVCIMPTTCGFPNCKFRSRYRGSDDNRHFYRVPKKPTVLRDRWLEAIGRTEETIINQVRMDHRSLRHHSQVTLLGCPWFVVKTSDFYLIYSYYFDMRVLMQLIRLV